MGKAPTIAVVLIALGAGTGAAVGADLQDFAAVERGRYLANAADCGSCHTVPGSEHPFSGGRPIETPFGVLAAPNITPDRETGIGSWTNNEFDAAVRRGISRNGARLYPAMPFPYYTRMCAKTWLTSAPTSTRLRPYIMQCKSIGCRFHSICARR